MHNIRDRWHLNKELQSFRRDAEAAPAAGDLLIYQADTCEWVFFEKTRVALNAVESIANITWTLVPWDVEDYDIGAQWAVGSPTYIYAAVNGYYHIDAGWTWDVTAGGANFQMRIYTSGAAILARHDDNLIANYDSSTMSCDYYLTAGTGVGLRVYQASGGAVNLMPAGCFLSMHRFG